MMVQTAEGRYENGDLYCYEGRDGRWYVRKDGSYMADFDTESEALHYCLQIVPTYPWTWGSILGHLADRPPRNEALCARRKAEREEMTARRCWPPVFAPKEAR